MLGQIILKYNLALESAEKEIEELKKENAELKKRQSDALKFIQEKRPTTPGLGALEMILGKFQ